MLHRSIARRATAAQLDRGDTLIELVIAVAIIAITAAALLGSVLTSITSSAEHKTIAFNDVYLKSYADAAQQQIQRQNNPLFHNCASSYTITPPSDIPNTYTVGISNIQYWDGSTWASTCPGSGTPPQLITVTVTAPTQISAALSFAVRCPTLTCPS